MEDELVPDAVGPDDAVLHFSIFPVHSKVQQPFLERRSGATLNLQTGLLKPWIQAAGCLTGGRGIWRQITYFVVDAVEKSRHHWENGWLQEFHVIWQQSDVTLEESNAGSSAVHHGLQEEQTCGYEYKHPL